MTETKKIEMELKLINQNLVIKTILNDKEWEFKLSAKRVLAFLINNFDKKYEALEILIEDIDDLSQFEHLRDIVSDKIDEIADTCVCCRESALKEKKIILKCSYASMEEPGCDKKLCEPCFYEHKDSPHVARCENSIRSCEYLDWESKED